MSLVMRRSGCLILFALMLLAGCRERDVAGRRPDLVFGEKGMGPGQFVYPRAIAIARGVRRSIRANLRFAAAYNGVGMALAAAGWLHPVAAALLMVGSSAFVSVRALRSGGARKTRP